MPKPELTKKLIADALKKLSAHKHLDKISISEIVDSAGLNRQTFYYHFQDKQELVCWIFDSDVISLTDKTSNAALLSDIVGHLYSERTFYIDALTSDVQNNLREHLFKYCYLRCTDELLIILGSRKMDEKAQQMVAEFFTHAVVGSVVRWAQEGMKTDNQQFVGDYGPFLKGQLVFAINYYVNDNSGGN